MRNLVLFLILFSAGCKKDNTAPALTLKTGAGYTYSDLTLAPSQTFVVGMDATSGASDLSMAYTEVAFDGANSPRLVSRLYTNASQKKHYEKDITVTTRSTPGTERWVFNINDDDGRITKKEIRVTVQ
jgi:hypothetical protein